MTPKEKAKQLVHKYYDLFFVELENSISILESKECALIFVDEMLWETLYQNTGFDSLERIKYWIQVKKEINKLC